MRMICVTDIHGDFSRLQALLYLTVADVYIIVGDLIDIPFYTMDSAVRYHDLQTFFHALRTRTGRSGASLEDFVEGLLDSPDIPDSVQTKGALYQQYTIRARRVMQQKYKVLENILSTKPSARILCLPGNYDMDLRFTALHERDLHLHWHQIGSLKIAGYGGADVWTMGIPERYIVRYRAGIGANERNNEMYRFFKAIKPDILITHQPPYGIHDRIPSQGPSGSPSLRAFCENHPVQLLLSGHIHNQWGFCFADETVFLNPSNFGEVTKITGEDVSEGGFFYGLDIEGKQVERIVLQKLVEERIYDVAEHILANGRWAETVVDRDRYEALQRRENVDRKTTKYSHIPEIALYNELKRFYRLFQTPETRERVERMEEVARLMEEKIRGDIAMDILGSVNVGMSRSDSDIDFVLYLRCDGTCDVMPEHCAKHAQARDMIQGILGGVYRAEIMDCVDLNVVEKSIREKNYECEPTQRFVAYRSICRPVHYRVIAPVEDLLNEDIEFRKELEGSVRSYFQIFATTSQHVRSFRKYEDRLGAVGIKLPASIRDKVRQYLQEYDGEGRGKAQRPAPAGTPPGKPPLPEKGKP